MGLVFEILLPLVFYLVYYFYKEFVKPFAGLIFIFLGSIRKKDSPARIVLNQFCMSLVNDIVILLCVVL